ncbi:MAG: metal-sulfur cluster assembly factor [Patescibacteria group bacterium]|nr:metal-sulfur cluster assembly factor [Patescibacteria group bacterium]
MHTEKDIHEKLKEIKDPELGIDIITLGLIRAISMDDSQKTGVPGVEILMTLTSPFCPFADELIAQIESAIEGLGFEDVRVELTFDPPWEPGPDLREMLGV